MIAAIDETTEVKELRRRQDEILGKLHGLTLSRDAWSLTLEESMPREIELVQDLGRVQERLMVLGAHAYDACELCRPGGRERTGRSDVWISRAGPESQAIMPDRLPGARRE